MTNYEHEMIVAKLSDHYGLRGIPAHFIQRRIDAAAPNWSISDITFTIANAWQVRQIGAHEGNA